MQAFAYDQPASRVIFGVGALERLREEIERLGVKRVLYLFARPDAGRLRLRQRSA